MRVESYAVQCDECHGRRYIAGFLCPTCDGNGEIVRKKAVAFGSQAWIGLLVAFVAAMCTGGAIVYTAYWAVKAMRP